jgi:hypothetical protein
MRYLFTILAGIVVLATPNRSFAQSAPYWWTISDSNTTPYVNTDMTTGFHTVYLWFSCSRPDPFGPGGMAVAEFAIVTSPPGPNLHVATNMQNGFLNAGTTMDLLLAVGGCPVGPVVAANLLIIVNVPGSMCLAPGSMGNKSTVDCSQNPQPWPIDWVGLSLLGGSACAKAVPPCPHVDFFCLYCDPVKGCSVRIQGVPCEPPNNCDDCPPTPVEVESWGSTKARYRE